MRDSGQLVAIQLAPTANIGMAKLDEVDRAFELGPPLDWLDFVLARVNLDKGPRPEPSVVRAKAAMRGHFKTGHMEWPGT
jgi:hypothetical protein